MTTLTLSLGCALLAFSPVTSLLLLLLYSKAQLIIVVTTSAFAFLLSSLASSIIWIILPASVRSLPFILIPLSSLCQGACRVGFVSLYIKIESVISASIQKHEKDAIRRLRNNTNAEMTDAERGELENAIIGESSRLRLEMNDYSCGFASGVGFGGMHALMLYGTLLTSEGMDSEGSGTLYQSSCPEIPSIVNSALNAFMFEILDIIWMLMTFYGVRRLNNISEGGRLLSGNFTVGLTVVSHTAAGFTTVLNLLDSGCLASLPVLGLIVCSVTFWFSAYINPIFLPKTHRRRMEGDPSRGPSTNSGEPLEAAGMFVGNRAHEE